MITTFERLAKVIKGETLPANWVESAFAAILAKLLPSVTSSDAGKILIVNALGEWEAGSIPSAQGVMF